MSFLFLRPILVFCATAIAIALLLDGAMFAVLYARGWSGLWFRGSGGVLLFGMIWAAAFVIGIFVARYLHIFPFFTPTR